MKKLLLSLFLLGAFKFSIAQEGYKKLPSLGIHFTLNDFETATELRATNLTSVLRTKNYKLNDRREPGLAITYFEGLSEYLDLAVSLSGTFVDYDVPNLGKSGSDRFLLEGSATANLKLLTDKHAVSPFLTFGVGAFSYRSSFGAFIPAGVGLQVKMTRDIFFLLNSQYRIPVSDKGAYHFYHGLGIAAPLKNRKEIVVAPPPPPVVLDRDNDGVLDADDKCPDVAGLANLSGCPDRDSDGIADADDNCPDVAGLAKYNGCPIPDTDGDGINDELDKCPAVKGFARYEGCAIPDTDADGVNDEEDKCPSSPGPASNMGCPEIAKEVIEKVNFAAKNIFFATGSAKLLPKSFKSLNEVSSLLASDESLMINIDGHTDSTGSADKNKVLSDDRANSVKTYLVGKGIAESRISATGYGPEKPIAPNKTAAGRAKNRRVELTVRNY